MSGSNPIAVMDELRRRFAIWGLAIFGSLAGSGNVQLESSAWGADDPPTEAKSDAKPDSDKKGQDAEPFDRAAFQQLIQAKDFEAAAKMIDAAMAAGPNGNLLYMNGMLASAMIGARDAAGHKRMEDVARLSADALKTDQSSQVNFAFAMSHQSLATQLANKSQVKEAITLLQGALAKAEEAKPGYQPPQLTSMLMAMLMREGRADEAKEIGTKRLNASLAEAKDKPNTVTRMALGSAFSQYSSSMGSKFPEDVAKAYTSVESILREGVEAESANVNDYTAYQSVQTAMAMAKAETSAADAMKILEETRQLGEKLAERLEDGEQKRLKAAQASLGSTESRLKSKLLHQSLIGQAAPEFDTEAVVNMSKVNWADLKGKVVLIDFWAVWCGPCIATFPHLQEWKKKYEDKGFVIIGVTRQYGYKWDKEQGKHVADKEASLETELEMLEEFRKAHELEHGFVVTPKGSDYNSKFGVTGIPQAVLVDQNGVIQMIRVGSGEKNAEDLEDKIKSLLGV